MKEGRQLLIGSLSLYSRCQACEKLRRDEERGEEEQEGQEGKRGGEPVEWTPMGAVTTARGSKIRVMVETCCCAG